ARRQAIRSAEPAEEALHRRARLERRVVVVVGTVVFRELLVDVDLHRNHRRLDALDNVGKPDRLLDLTDFVVDLRVRGAREDVDRSARGAEAVNGNAEAGNDRGHQGKFARGKQRTAGRLVRWEGRKISGTFGHTEISRSQKSMVRGRAPDSSEHGDFRLTARWRGD